MVVRPPLFPPWHIDEGGSRERRKFGSAYCHWIEWKPTSIGTRRDLENELERVYDIVTAVAGQSARAKFSTLFGLWADESGHHGGGRPTRPITSRSWTSAISATCVLYDRCLYVLPHEWNVTPAPHAAGLRSSSGAGCQSAGLVLTSTDTVFRMTSIPLVSRRQCPERQRWFPQGVGIHRRHSPRRTSAEIPQQDSAQAGQAVATRARAGAGGDIPGKVALYATCYGNYNSPEVGADFNKVFQHNGGIYIDVVPEGEVLWHARWNSGDLTP